MTFLGNLLQRQEFFPSFLGIFTNAAYFGRKGLLEHIRRYAPRLKGRILDVGCGTKPYRELFLTSEYVGLEIDTPENRRNKNADFFYSGTEFPFQDQEFDVVITSQVLEHVFDPGAFAMEIHRVLKVGGTLLLTVPFIWEEHEQPYDFGRYSSFGIAHLLRQHGFTILEQRKSVTGIRAIAQLHNCYLRRKFRLHNRKIRLLTNIFLFGITNILGILLSAVLPDHKDLYIDNIVLAERHEI